jgi:Bacterial archaeo-eukaryotic release factor family 11
MTSHPSGVDRGCEPVTLHTDIPTRFEVQRLLATREPHCVSAYLPTSPITQDAQADRIELKNLVAEASGQMEATTEDRRAVSGVRESLYALVDDDDFWREQARSLAVFASPGGLRTFRLPNRLQSIVEVGDRFYVKPLLRAITFPQAAFVLALAAGSVRLVEVTREGPPFAVDVPDLPPEPVRETIRLRQYARKVDQALRAVLSGLELPLILAATEPLGSIYRSLNSYPHLVDPRIPGNPEAASDDDLAAAARTILDDVYAEELAALRDLFELRFSHGRASTDVATVARTATQGAVDTLLVDIDDKLPGHVDEDSGAVAFAEDDADSYGVVDEIARRVLLTGGRVLAVRASDIPGGGPLAAILRYAP